MPHNQGYASRIVALASAGYAPTDIYRMVGCSRIYVHKVLASRKLTGNGRYSPLPRDDFVWLRTEAEKNGVPVADFARALLVDAIEDAKGGN